MPEPQPSQPHDGQLESAGTFAEHHGMEEALRASEARYRVLVEQIPGIIYTTSFAEAGTTFYVSPQIERILGFSQADWTDGPRLWISRLHPEDRRRVLAELAKSHESGDPFVTEYRLIARDGRTLWFHDEATVVRDQDGGPLCLQGVMLDVTERVQAEESVRRRNRELELLNRAGRAFSSSLDLASVLRIVLDQVRRLLGVAASSVWLIDPETGDLICQQATGVMAETVLGWRLPAGQGIAGWVVRNKKGLIVSDVRTDERHFEGIDTHTGLELRSILTAPMQVKQEVIGVIQVLDTAIDRFTKIDLTLLESLTVSAATAIENARLYERAQKEIAERVRAEKALREERANLAQRVAERTAELSMANAELARAARLKDEFLAAMSHELRTPLNAILGLSETLQEGVYGALNEKQLQSLHSVVESGHHLLMLINDILDVAKIEAGKMELQTGPVPVESTCRASLGLVRQLAHKKGLKVVLDLDSQVTVLQADARRLKQILVNLLSNAIKFTPEGGTIGLEVSGDREREVVHLSVWDSGIGIAEEEMKRLFRPFVQLDSRLSRRHGGTGLGLALVRRLTELHGGGVAVESQVGRGSRFTVSLPWQPSDSTNVPEKEETAEVEPPLPVPAFSLPSPLLLLADDNEANILTMSGYLEAKGCRVIMARNGVEAIQRAREEHPDVILMDIQMPEVDGLEATRRIRASPGLEGVPIVALTALAMPGDRERCLEAGANEYLSKPVSLKQVAKTIERELRAATEA